MRTFLTVVAFTLITIGLFAGYSNFGIPQIEPAPPPKEEKIELGSMTIENFIILGEKFLMERARARYATTPLDALLIWQP